MIGSGSCMAQILLYGLVADHAATVVFVDGDCLLDRGSWIDDPLRAGAQVVLGLSVRNHGRSNAAGRHEPAQ